jgi:hypothetical protein
MKSIVKYLLIVILGGGAMVFADGGFSCPTCGQPPNGIGIDGKAQGTKLDGVLSIEFYNKVFHPETLTTPAHTSADGRFVLRLKKGSDFAMFYTEADIADTGDPTVVQAVITDNLEDDVLARFFPDKIGLTIKLKAIDQFGALNTATTVPFPSTSSTFILSNIQLAVQ